MEKEWEEEVGEEQEEGKEKEEAMKTERDGRRRKGILHFSP